MTKNKGENIDKITRVLDVSRPTIERWIAGQSRPHKAVAAELIRMLDNIGGSIAAGLRAELGGND